MADIQRLVALINFIIEEIDDPESCWTKPRSSSSKGCILSTVLRSNHIKIPGYVDEIVGNYLMVDFKRLFRVSPLTYQRLCKYLAPLPEMMPSPSPHGRPPVPLHQKVLVGLWYIGTQDSLKQISDRFNITESCALKCRNQFISAVSNSLRRRFIAWPDQNEREEISGRFQARNGFPDIVGAIDATHVELKAPPEEDKGVYINRKGFYSLNVQAVCRENMLFTHCYLGWPGSVHDSRILRNSDLWDNGLVMCGNQHLIGDGGYPTRRWLLTPYRNDGALTRQQKHFNYLLSSNRTVIERAFGLLKARFRRLAFVNIQTKIPRLQAVMTCFIMHNICIIGDDQLDECNGVGFDNNPGLLAIANMENEAEGMLKRDRLARQLFH